MTTPAKPHSHAPIVDAAAHASGRLPSGRAAGAVLRAARLSAGLTQAALADRCGADTGNLRGWEDGSFPLADVPAACLERLETALRDAGADPQLVADLGPAIWCDLVVRAIAACEDTACLLADPTAGLDAFRELLAWRVTGHVPVRYRAYAPGRGRIV